MHLLLCCAHIPVFIVGISGSDQRGGESSWWGRGRGVEVLPQAAHFHLAASNNLFILPSKFLYLSCKIDFSVFNFLQDANDEVDCECMASLPETPFNHDWTKRPSLEAKQKMARLMEKHSLTNTIMYKICTLEVSISKFSLASTICIHS